jgi:hypothetical protein
MKLQLKPEAPPRESWGPGEGTGEKGPPMLPFRCLTFPLVPCDFIHTLSPLRGLGAMIAYS